MGFFDFLKRNVSAPETGIHLKQALIGKIIDALPNIAFINHQIIGIKLYFLISSLNKIAYQTIVSSPDFRKDLDRNFKNSFISLPENWTLTFEWLDTLPDTHLAILDDVSLEIFQKGMVTVDSSKTAQITAIRGQLAEKKYELEPTANQRYNIGRCKKAILDNGWEHENYIVFLNNDEEDFDEEIGKNNGSVSRNHAYIAFDSMKQHFCLYAYKGGLAFEGNSTKILRLEQTINLTIDSQPYPLHDGDQIKLSQEISLKFSLK